MPGNARRLQRWKPVLFKVLDRSTLCYPGREVWWVKKIQWDFSIYQTALTAAARLVTLRRSAGVVACRHWFSSSTDDKIVDKNYRLIVCNFAIFRRSAETHNRKHQQVAAVIVATERIAAAAQIDSSYSAGDASVTMCTRTWHMRISNTSNTMHYLIHN